jgi:hypothetical protein
MNKTVDHWIAVADTLKQQRDQAEKERDALRKDAARVCKWREDDPDFGTWRTGCGHLWSFNAGGPEENDAKFCQYCGGALAVAPPALAVQP